MMSFKPVRACLCAGRSFANLLPEVRQNAWTSVEEIAAHTGCGGGCGMCQPYLERMLETGETVFSVIPEAWIA